MRVISAADLKEDDPAEREATFKDSIIRHLNDTPADCRDVIEAQRALVLEREARLRKKRPARVGSRRDPMGRPRHP